MIAWLGAIPLAVRTRDYWWAWALASITHLAVTLRLAHLVDRRASKA